MPGIKQQAVDRLEAAGLDGDEFRIEQNLIRNRYTVYDADGQEILKGKQKLFKLKEEFPFTTPDDEPVFTVKAQQMLDLAGDYVILDAATEDPLIVLRKKFTFFHHAWRIVDADTGDILAHVESESLLLDVLRGLISIFTLFPYTYNITTPTGEPMGRIREHFSLRDKYDVFIHDAKGIPRGALVAACIVIDALEGN